MTLNTLPGPDDVTRRELPNGIVVLVRENHYSPSAVITGSINAGALFDPADALGLSSFSTAMVMRGTERRSFQDIHELLEGNGASLGLSGGKHTVGFGGKSLAEDLPLLLDLLSEALRCPVFPQDHIERLRGQVVTSMKIHEQDSRFMAGKLFRELVYPADHPYYTPTEGTIESVSALTRAQLADFHRRNFGPQGMLLVIVGAVRADEAVALVEQHFGGWQNPDQPSLPEVPDVAPPGEASIQYHAMPDKSQSDLVWGVPGPSRFASDWQAANLANSILGVFGMFGRIGLEVREKRGMAYHCSSRLDSGLGPGIWRVTAGVSPANVAVTVEAIRQEIRRMVRETVSDEELADNKSYFTGYLPLQLETNEGVAGALLGVERYQLGPDYLRRYESVVNAVTADQVLEAAQHYLNPDAYALAVAGPALPE